MRVYPQMKQIGRRRNVMERIGRISFGIPMGSSPVSPEQPAWTRAGKYEDAALGRLATEERTEESHDSETDSFRIFDDMENT